MKNNLIITIGRQYGSGGHEIGEKLAKHMTFPVMTKNCLPELLKKVVFARK